MLKVLVVDDSDLVRQLVKAALSRETGWSICGEAFNGRQAMDLAREAKPDLIVMDLAMPVLDGLHASTEILKFAPALPIVLYTLHANPQVDVEAKKIGIRAVVSKSSDIETLVKVIAELAGKVPSSPLAATGREISTSTPTSSELKTIVMETLASSAPSNSAPATGVERSAMASAAAADGTASATSALAPAPAEPTSTPTSEASSPSQSSS
jgi:DNA-binding NarL/FixJ family response regulator